ncbi:MAG TPA: adenosine kinase [Acidimicrobiales bacterium]|nr:adenosine kinase [Acidimicrobiales bacterium]
MEPDLAVVGIGNALVDVLVETEPEVIEACGVPKGSMMLMALDEAERIHDQVGPGIERSGGSAANTAAGLAALGAPAAFIGRVADDRLGKIFGHDIGSLGVVFGGTRSVGSGTGRCLILVTPDADRTMCTSLGVAAELDSDDIDESLVERAAVTYLEGYLFDLPPAKEAFRRAISVAHRAGRRVAMSLSDPFCVTRHRNDFAALVDSELDLLFANADEVCELTGVDDVEEACGRLRRPGLTVTVTRGALGAVTFAGDGPVVQVPAVAVDRVVDTTGAGDLYAAGYLFGWTRSLSPERCARLGAIAAAEIISHLGARPEADLAALAAPTLSR